MRVYGPLAHLWADDRGMTSTEYALLLAVLSLSAVVAFGQLSDRAIDVANESSSLLEEAFGMGCAPGG